MKTEYELFLETAKERKYSNEQLTEELSCLLITRKENHSLYNERVQAKNLIVIKQITSHLISEYQKESYPLTNKVPFEEWIKLTHYNK